MIFGFVSENLKTRAVAVAFSMAWLEGDVEQRLAAFRGKMYRCFTARGDVAGRADQAGRGCQELAAARRGVQPGAVVLPRVLPGEVAGADDPGLT